MIQLNLLEKLEISNEKNFLIQGLPSSIEKQFIKLSYSKNVTPLLKTRKIDFALVFAITGHQLNTILRDVLPSLSKTGKLWVAYPKTTSKIVSDLNREGNWEILVKNNFVSVTEVPLDHVWTASRFERTDNGTEEIIFMEARKIKGIDFDKKLVVPPIELEKIFSAQRKAREAFHSLSTSHQAEYVTWIEGAKRKETRTRRLEATVEKLLAGKKTPSEK